MPKESKKPSETVLNMWLGNFEMLKQLADTYREQGDTKAAQEKDEQALIIAKAIRAGVEA